MLKCLSCKILKLCFLYDKMIILRIFFKNTYFFFSNFHFSAICNIKVTVYICVIHKFWYESAIDRSSQTLPVQIDYGYFIGI